VAMGEEEFPNPHLEKSFICFEQNPLHQK
jgi:hypothetical protein